MGTRTRWLLIQEWISWRHEMNRDGHDDMIVHEHDVT